MSPSERVASRFKEAGYFNVDDIVLYGKYKNHTGRVVRVFKDERGNPAIEVEPVPKGRKQNKIISILKVWHQDLTKRASAESTLSRFLEEISPKP